METAVRGEAETGTAAGPGRFLVDMMKSRLARLFIWMGATAAMTYYFDPDRGEKRRKDLLKRFEKMRKMGRKARLQAGL